MDCGVVPKIRGRLSSEKALSLRPQYVEAMQNLGNAMVELLRVPEAIDAYRRSYDQKLWMKTRQ
jgi:hypothetical protein